jgi:hypothetical protein
MKPHKRSFTPLIGLTLLVAMLLGTGNVTARDSAPAPALKTIDLVVSLEWEPGNTDTLRRDLLPADCAATETTYLNDLELSLKNTAAYLYNFTEGQMTLGKIAIYTGGEKWDQADIRVLANSAYRPTAFVGGIVDAPQRVETRAGRPVLYYPAPMLLGRLWDGKGARCGAWGDPAGWRTLGHEIGHYALFLFDQYFNVETGAEQYCTSSGVEFGAIARDTIGVADTLMAYHYSADKLWRGGTPPVLERPALRCAGSPQDYVHGASEWATITRFYPELSDAVRLPPMTLSTIKAELGSRGLPSINIGAAPTFEDTTAPVKLDPLRDAPASKTAVGDAYLVRLNSAGDPARIVGQGWVLPGEKNPPPFWGAAPDKRDRAGIYVYDETNRKRFATPSDFRDTARLDLAAVNTFEAKPSIWRPSIVITPTVQMVGLFSEATELNVRLTDCARAVKQVQFVYCPAGGDCSKPANATLQADGSFFYTFTFPDALQNQRPAQHGYIYARGDTIEETTVWYQIGGGVGPAHTGSHAPLVDGLVNTDMPPGRPGPTRDSRVLSNPTPVCTSSSALPPGIAGIIGAPYSIRPIIAGDPQFPNDRGAGWGQDPANPLLRVRLGYSQDLLDRLSIAEDQLVIVRLNANNVWEIVPTAGQSALLDWITGAPQNFGGDGEFYALAYRTSFTGRVFLPLVQ